MKQLILTLTLFTTTLTVTFSQEKQSDATWEETIQFIKQNSSFMGDGLEFKNVQYDINFIENLQFNSYIMKYNVNNTISEIDLSKLNNLVEIEDNPENRFFLELTGKYAKKTFVYYDESPTIKHMNRVALIVSDNDMAIRIKKAFQHLTYLAIQKREVERKAFGDKF